MEPPERTFSNQASSISPKCCTRSCNVYNVWQQNYWEHIIRDENELNKIRVYIRNNPLKWQDDKLNDDRVNVIQEETGRGEKYYAPNEEW